MQVYIEYVVADNLIIDYLLLSAAVKLTRAKSCFWQKMLGTVIGVTAAIIFPLLNINGTYLITCKIAVACLMVLVSASFRTVKRYFFALIAFLIMTFAVGGAIIGCFYLAGVDYKLYFETKQNAFFPVGLSILAVYFLTKLTTKAVNKLLMQRDVQPFIRKCVVIIGNNKFHALGYIDSGNRLFDPVSGLPIIVASKNFTEKLAKNRMLTSTNKYLSFTTVGGASQMKIYKLDKLVINKGATESIFNNVLMGVSAENFTNDGEYELLLSPSLV